MKVISSAVSAVLTAQTEDELLSRPGSDVSDPPSTRYHMTEA